MIIDTLDHWQHYHFSSAWKVAFDFLFSLSPDSEEKRYELRGDDIFAQIATYETIVRESTVFESHRKYVDIQVLLAGSERIETAFRDQLVVTTPYDEAQDVEFYELAESVTDLRLYPGTFAMLYPHDAHMPCLMSGETPEKVKKVVVKLKRELLAAF